MAEQKTGNREKVKEIVAGIESGIKDLFQSDRYAEYLRTMSRFHNYSYRNTLLIHSQRPDATLVAGFTKWKNQFQRHVKKGERGMTILAPTPFKKKIEQQKLDPDTHAPVRDEDGNIVTEERTVEIPMFRPVKVFDVKQTDGKPLPSLFMDLTGNVRHYEAFLDALCRTSPVPIDFKPIAENMDGYFSPARQRIAIQDNLSEIQTVCTVVHEITHAVLHNREQDQQAAAAGTEGAEPKKPKDEQTMEVEAESVAYAVCQYYGIETSASSLGYIASWSSGKELPELKASLETISKTADFLITNIDRHFAEICKERGIVLEQTETFAEDIPAEDAPAEDVPAGDIPAATPPVEEESPPPKAEAETQYLYCSEYNPQHVGENDFRFIRVRTLGDDGPSPNQILFCGSASLCDKLLTDLETGKLHHDDFFHVNSARVSRYRMKDGAELDAFVAPDDKVYLGRRDHYDNRGHYLNHDKSLLHVSDNPEMFNFLSGKGYTETQAEMLKERYFTPELYAEFAALQADVLAQFEEREPLLFAGEPFCFIPLDPSEVKLDSSPAQEAMKQEEVLYLVDNTTYLHIQTSDAGYDYTLYDKATMRQLDGGQIDPLDVDEHFSQGDLRPVADAVLISAPNLVGETVEEMPLELLETLQEKALLDVQEAADAVQQAGHFTGEDAAVLDTVLDEYPMPDPAYSKEDAERDFAYLEGYLLPLSKERAEELMEKDFSIYAIVDEYARMVFDREELDQCPPDIAYAMPTGEWEESPEFHQAVADRMNHQEEREQAFLRYAGDCFAIYQIKDDDPDRLRFMDMDWLTSKGLTVDRARYELAYTGELACGLGSSALGQLWEEFNIHHPADYHRPSMSVSDIIAVKQDGVISCHYCDSVGFAKVPGFIGGGTKEPTVADLEAQANAGKQISLVDLAGAVQRERDAKKKSVVSQLKEKPAQERRKTRRQKNLENGR